MADKDYIGPTGAVVRADSGQQKELDRNSSYKPITVEEANVRHGANENLRYADEHYGTVGKALLGASDGLTLGLGPALASEAGLIDKGHLRAAQTSGIYTAGQVAGFALPALLTGGGSAAAEGGAAATAEGGSLIARALGATPAGMMGTMGGVAERAVSRFLPEAGIVGKALSGAASMAARGAAEGALIASSANLSKNIINDHPLTAESLVAAGEAGLHGALFGAAGGALLGGATGLLKGARSSLASRSVVAAEEGEAAVIRGGERKAGEALTRAGYTGAEVAKMEAGDGVVTKLQEVVDVLKKSGTSFADNTQTMLARVQKTQAESLLVAEAKLAEIAENSARPTPAVFSANIRKDIGLLFDEGLTRRFGEGVTKGLERDLQSVTSWKGIAKAREDLADRLQKTAIGTDENKALGAALNAYDRTLFSEVQREAPEVANAYLAATAQARLSKEVASALKARLGTEANRGSALGMNGGDANTLGWGVVSGNPLFAGATFAVKKMLAYGERKLEPAMAEYSARSALGSRAGAVTVQTQGRIGGSINDFLGVAKKTNFKNNIENATSPEPSAKKDYSRKAYQGALFAVEKLSAPDVQATTQRQTEQFISAGYPELGQAWADVQLRKMAYLAHNLPKADSPFARLGSLTKQPVAADVSLAGQKFIRQVMAGNDPVGTLSRGLSKGDLSRDEVLTIKNIYPQIHSQVVQKAASAIMEMKQQGLYLAPQKLAQLGVLLDYPVDSTLQPDFIQAVQKSFQPAPKEEAPSGDAAIQDSSAYETPLQGK